MRRIYRVQRFDFWVAVAAIIGTLVFGVLAGVIIGIGLSLLWLVAVATRPQYRPAWAASPAPRSSATSPRTPTDEQPPGIAVVRLDGGLFFATADALEDRIRDVIHTPAGSTGIVLDCEGINFVDSQGSAKMAEIARLAEESGLTLRLARVKPAVAADLGPGWSARTDRARPHPRQRPPGRTGAKGCDRRQGRPGAGLTPPISAPSSR